MARKVKTFQVDDLGIENPQYFQGYGVAFSQFTDCCYGIGDNPGEALEDCLNQCAEMDVDTEDLEARIKATYPDIIGATYPSVSDEYDEDSGDGEPCELYYHVGIKWTFAD